MNKVFHKLPALVAEELEAANAEHALFHSMHEGYAVMLEEVEECADELQRLQADMNVAWNNVKQDKTGVALYAARRVLREALYLAAEAIQVAAMAQKFTDSFKEGNA